MNKEPVMRRTLRNSRSLTLLLIGTMAFAAARSLGAQQQPPFPEGYIRGFFTATLGWGDSANGWAFKKTSIDQKRNHF